MKRAKGLATGIRLVGYIPGVTLSAVARELEEIGEGEDAIWYTEMGRNAWLAEVMS